MKNLIFLTIIFLFFSLGFSQEKNFHRPDPQGITDFLAGKLDLSPQQREKIKKAVEKKAVEFDKVNSKYVKKEAEIEALKKEMEPMALKMEEIYKSLPETVIPFLDDAQKVKFEELRKPPKREPAEVKDAPPSPDGKKRKLVKRKKSAAGAVAEPSKENKEEKKEQPPVSSNKEEVKSQTNQAEVDIFYP